MLLHALDRDNGMLRTAKRQKDVLADGANCG
jgi:hypothetical protein